MSDEQYHQLVTALHRQWLVATRAVMIPAVRVRSVVCHLLLCCRPSTPSQSAVLPAVDVRLGEIGGASVPRPSRATAYRRLAELMK